MGQSSVERMATDTSLPLPDTMPNPLSVYVPFESLTEKLLKSVIAVLCRSSNRFSEEKSTRPLLCFLLAMINKVEQIEEEGKKDPTKRDPHATNVRRWLADPSGREITRTSLQDAFNKIYKEVPDRSGHYRLLREDQLYYEMNLPLKIPDIVRSRQYMEKSRPNGYEAKELKVYWNYEQIATLCGSPDPPHDPSDRDVIENLHQSPIKQRKNQGKIDYITMGIEKAVFEVPEGAQIILLNFANEQSPGGGYLRHAIAQEEVLLYNSDGYRALLDLKYGRMGGGYAIPEFGLAYVRNIRVFDRQDSEKSRQADMLVSACYCMDYPQLYDNPQDFQSWYQNNFEKFRAFMAAAVANTIGDGSNTYLLLGPIGTGAFGNDTKEIAKVFRDVLKEKLLGMEIPVRYAFKSIWFVSIDGWKNDVFKEIIEPPAEVPEPASPQVMETESVAEPVAKPTTPVEAAPVVAASENDSDKVHDG